MLPKITKEEQALIDWTNGMTARFEKIAETEDIDNLEKAWDKLSPPEQRQLDPYLKDAINTALEKNIKEEMAGRFDDHLFTQEELDKIINDGIDKAEEEVKKEEQTLIAKFEAIAVAHGGDAIDDAWYNLMPEQRSLLKPYLSGFHQIATDVHADFSPLVQIKEERDNA